MEKKLLRILAAGVIVLLIAGEAFTAGKKLNVVATLPDLASLARAVGGEHVKVSSIALGVQDPHYLEAKPTYQITLSRADLLIYNGLQLEIGWLPLLARGARNPRISPQSPGSLNASLAIDKILEVPAGEVDRSMGDIHPLGNPHYLLDPRNGVKVAALIKDRLSELDSPHQSDYAANYQAFAEMMKQKIAGWEEQAEPLRGKEVVAYHKQWEYLADWLGLKIVDYVEDKPGIPPTPQHFAHLIQLIKEKQIKVIMIANFSPGMRKAQRLAEETGAALLVLPASTGGEPEIKEYPDLFDYLIPALKKGFER